MKINKTASECCGCSACAQVCPTKAIKMTADKEGFLYPQIDEQKCVDCGRCVGVCSFNDDYVRANGQTEKEFFALLHKNQDVREQSRSGGAFFAAAEAIIAEGGAVYGVALDDSLEARTVRIDKAEELCRLQGSKYVQSDKGNSFSLIREDLENGLSVLFSGTGCEVSALHSYLVAVKTSTERLYTCDIVCHGVPSPLVWRDNLKYMESKLGARIDSASFRDKVFGWAPHIESYRSGSKIRYANRYTSVFYANLTLRPSCGVCRFCNYERPGDISIADFWGKEKLNLDTATTDGLSMLMVNTEQGKRLLEKISGDVDTYKVKKEDTLQPNLQRPSKLPDSRESFWEDYQRLGYKKATDKYYTPTERAKLVYNYLLRRKTK